MKTPTFEEFYAAHKNTVRADIHRLVGAAALFHEDLEQETWIKIWKAYPTLDHSRNTRGWVGRIAWRTACDFLRAHRNRSLTDIPLDDVLAEKLAETLPDPSQGVGIGWDTLIWNGEADIIERMYACLKERERTVLSLLLCEWKAAEIEVASLGALSEFIIHRIRTRLRMLYAQENTA